MRGSKHHAPCFFLAPGFFMRGAAAGLSDSWGRHWSGVGRVALYKNRTIVSHSFSCICLINTTVDCTAL